MQALAYANARRPSVSGLGLLATALAGGAGVIGKQAGDDIEQGRKADLMRQQADIEEQMRMRLAERQEQMRREGVLWGTTGEGGAASLDLARRSGEQANDLSIKGKVAEATNPELAAAKDTQAEAELQRDIKRINATSKPEAEKAAAIAEARARAEAKYRKADPTVQSKVRELETALGRKLTEPELMKALGMTAGRDPDTGYETVVEKQFDGQGNETGSVTRKVPIKGGQGGGREPAADPYAVPKRAGAPAAKPGAASPKPDAAPAGPGMLASLREAVSGAMGEGAKTGNAIEALRAKVKSGAPLTAQETQMARKYGMGV